MKRTIALPYLAALLAENARISTDDAEHFLKAFFETVSEGLAAGEQVKIKGIGTFSVTADGEVNFTPDPALASAANAPFSAFRPVLLAEDVTFDETPDADDASEEPEEQGAEPESDENIAEEQPAVPDETPAEEVQEGATVEYTLDESTASEPVETVKPELSEAADEAGTDESVTDMAATDEATTDEATTDEAAADEPDYIYYDDDEKHFPWVWTGIGLVFGIIIGFVAGYFLQPKVDEWIAGNQSPAAEVTVDTIVTAPAATAALTDSTAPESIPAEKPIAEEVFDTIRTTRFLTTMARQHYGQMEYWVYIYLENADILGNPNRAKPGTVVRIPDLGKYLTSTDDSVNIARAKARAIEIYKPYR